MFHILNQAADCCEVIVVNTPSVREEGGGDYNEWRNTKSKTTKLLTRVTTGRTVDDDRTGRLSSWQKLSC